MRITRRYRTRELTSLEDSTGTYSGTGSEDADWGTGPIGSNVSAKDQWKQPVRVASTAALTLASAVEAGDTIDGVTLVAGDRVLLKDQAAGAENGIYVVQSSGTPTRGADMDDDDEVMGALVYVIAGTANGGKAYKNTNTTLPTVGSTSLTFTEFGAGGTPTFATPAIVLGTVAAAGAASTVIRSDATIVAFDATSPTTQAFGDSAVVGASAFAANRAHKHAMPTAAVTTSGLTQATARLLGRTTASTGAIEEITVGTGLSLSAGSLTATGGGSSLTVEEVDGSPTDSAVTKIVFPNGTLGIASHVATYTPSGGGGGSSATVPNVIQAKTNGNAVTSVTIAAASSGNRLILGTNSTTGQVTAPTCTNVTWTQMVTFTSTGSSYYAIWVGVVAGGSSGTSITMTKPGSFNTVCVLEVTDTLTPTASATGSGNIAAVAGTGADIRIFGRMSGSTAGRFIAMAYCLDNTGNVPQIFPGIPAAGVFQGPGNTLVVGYSGGAGVSFGGYGVNSAGAFVIAEVT